MSSSDSRFNIPKWPFYGAFVFFALVVSFWGFFVDRMDILALAGIFLCIGFSAVILIAPFWMEMLVHRHDQRTERVLSDEVRSALQKSEDLAKELERLQHETSKGFLLARQLPDRIDEKLKNLREQLKTSESDERAALRKEVDLLRNSRIASLQSFPMPLPTWILSCIR
jgi:hypothetical protein